MYAKGRKAGTIRFSFKPDGQPNKVEVAGDFNGWKPVTMKRQKNGSYVATVPVTDGGHTQYKFLLDDSWVADPDNHIWVLNPYGTLNSVAETSAAAKKS